MRFTSTDYAELLGLYLGDGSISQHARTDRLRIVLDDKYPGIINDTSCLMKRCFPRNKISVGRGSKGRCSAVSLYSRHLVCLFPQHGEGPKHKRDVALEPWQEQIVNIAPWGFLRGSIRSDGCVFINRTNIHRPEPYEYLSYEFSNSSTDIVEIFLQACDRVGVFTRATRGSTGRWKIRINRRDSVALMLEHVGVKS